MARIVIIEDDAGLGDRLAATLRALGHDADRSTDGASARARAGRADAGIVLIDFGLPDAGGFELCGELRRLLPGRVLVALMARTEEMDVTKAVDGAVIRHGGIVIDRSARRCSTPAGEVELRPREFDLLVRLAASTGEAVSREDLMREVWDENWFGPTKTLDVHVAALRRKLGDRVRITTLRTFGYRLEAPTEG